MGLGSLGVLSPGKIYFFKYSIFGKKVLSLLQYGLIYVGRSSSPLPPIIAGKHLVKVITKELPCLFFYMWGWDYHTVQCERLGSRYLSLEIITNIYNKETLSTKSGFLMRSFEIKKRGLEFFIILRNRKCCLDRFRKIILRKFGIKSFYLFCRMAGIIKFCFAFLTQGNRSR